MRGVKRPCKLVLCWSLLIREKKGLVVAIAASAAFVVAVAIVRLWRWELMVAMKLCEACWYVGRAAAVGAKCVCCMALICYWQTPNYWPRCRFSMNANKIWCKSRFFIFDANAFHNDADAKCTYDAHVIFMMQMFLAGVQMQSLSMMVPAHIFNRDANVSLQRWRCKNVLWCKCLLMGMSWCKCFLHGCHDANVPLMHAMMWPSAWDYAMTWMSIWCKCPLIGVSWMRMPACRYAMNANVRLDMQWMSMPAWGMQWMQIVSLRVCHDTECFGANTIYSKISFIFKTRLPQCLKPKYFQTQFIIPEKSSSFWLKAPKKNWWSLLENLRMGHLLEIWWSGSKDLFPQFG